MRHRGCFIVKPQIGSLIVFLFGGLISGCGALTVTDQDVPSITVEGLPNGASLGSVVGNNVLSMTVNGSTCAAGSYQNKPCVNLTLCTPGTSTCQTITDILVDTGSYGLRVFDSLLTIAPTPLQVAGQDLAACARFADGTSLWGPVQSVDIKMGGEDAVTVPVQTIDSTYSDTFYSCDTPDQTPSQAGFNGILGVGSFREDCGAFCTVNPASSLYYRCSGSSNCTGTVVPLAKQVANPIAFLPVNNNGVILMLPSIGLGGTSAIEGGYMVLGIDTAANNGSTGVNALPMNPSTGQFRTTYKGVTIDSIIDSGSNAYYFPSTNAGIPNCNAYFSGGWYCPPSAIVQDATHIGHVSSPSINLNFYIGNLYNLLVAGGRVFIEMGGNAGGTTDFYWGLPFYIGRNVYHGLENTSSSLGAGPYTAY